MIVESEVFVALDLATRTFVEQMASAGGKPLHESTPEEARALGAALAAMAGPAPAMARVEEHTVAAPGGGVQVRVVVPIEPPRGVMMYYHGGGWVLGNIDEYDTLARKLAERTSCAVILVEYRLASRRVRPPSRSASSATSSSAVKGRLARSRPAAFRWLPASTPRANWRRSSTDGGPAHFGAHFITAAGAG